jgi:hypothetical protein
VKRISLVLIGLVVLSGMVGYAATTGLLTSGHESAVVNAPSSLSRAGTAVNDASGGNFLSEQVPAPKAADQSAQTVPASGSGSATQPGATSDVPTATAIGPKIIKTASLSVEVKKDGFANAFDSASLVAQKYNGFVVSSSTQGSKSKSGSLLIRVPMQSFDLAVHDLTALGTLDHQSVNGQDVTSQFVDLNARLRTWQSQENVLLRLMNKAHSINDTMQVQRELQQVQFQIEDIKGQLRVLNDQTSLGTIQLDLHEPGVVAAPPVEKNPKPNLGDAWDHAVSGFLGVISLVIVGLGYVLPLAAIGGGVWLGYRKIRSREAGSGAAA